MVFDAATVAAIRGIVLQAITEVLRPIAPQAQGVPVAPEVPRSEEQGNHVHQGGVIRDKGDYGRALKAINSMRPDSYDGKGEPVKVAHWFSHMERLFRNVECTEAEKVHIASLRLKEEASEWWESTGLADSPVLT